MASVNKFIGIGNLTKDPETRRMSNEESVTNIKIACNDQWKDKNGEKQEKVEFIRVVFYRKLAEIAGQYLKKGSSVYVEGRLETKKWTDKQGTERYTTQIIADTMQMLGSKSGGGSESSQQSNAPAQNKAGFDIENDLPF